MMLTLKNSKFFFTLLTESRTTVEMWAVLIAGAEYLKQDVAELHLALQETLLHRHSATLLVTNVVTTAMMRHSSG